MKKLINRYIIIIIILGIFSSCTDDYSEINTDPNTISDIGDSDIPFLFAYVERVSPLSNRPYSYQTGQNLFADQYAQYFCNNVTYFVTDRYTMVDEYLIDLWMAMYDYAAPQLLEILDKTDENSAENAIANIWWVYTFHHLTDYWGPIPYSKVGEMASTVPYDSQESIYNDFFSRLESADNILKEKTDETPFGKYDIIYGGDVTKWIKLGNTLRLRLAMRISNISPEKARAEAEAAYQNGVFDSSPDDDALTQSGSVFNYANPISRMADWNEFRMTATMESILKGYEDPRIAEYFMPSKKNGTYDGIRNGLTATQLGLSKNRANNLSKPGPRWTNPDDGGWDGFLSTPQNVMCAAEAYFLRAEGALLGWDMGASAEECYENGIRNSMYQWGITDETMINNYIDGTSLPIEPEDYLNSPAVTDVPVKFNTSDLDIANEQISIQKWLALFPDGLEAWADNRRSRYFKLYPVANSDNPDIADPTTQYIRRITFIVQEKLANGQATEDAVSLLKGADKISTPLWWDTND